MALYSNTTLERIILKENNIDGKLARLMPAMLANKRSLKRIDLKGNNITTNGVEVRALRLC